MMVFIGEKNSWGPSSGKLESKKTYFFVLASCRSSVTCFKQIQISTMHTSRWLRLHLFFGFILIDGVYT